jgi:hypothetical protein
VCVRRRLGSCLSSAGRWAANSQRLGLWLRRWGNAANTCHQFAGVDTQHTVQCLCVCGHLLLLQTHSHLMLLAQFVPCPTYQTTSCDCCRVCRARRPWFRLVSVPFGRSMGPLCRLLGTFCRAVLCLRDGTACAHTVPQHHMRMHV